MFKTWQNTIVASDVKSTQLSPSKVFRNVKQRAEGSARFPKDTRLRRSSNSYKKLSLFLHYKDKKQMHARIAPQPWKWIVDGESTSPVSVHCKVPFYLDVVLPLKLVYPRFRTH